MPVANAYRLILGREATPTEIDGGGPPHSVDPQDLANRLLLSPEFRDAYFALTARRGSAGDRPI